VALVLVSAARAEAPRASAAAKLRFGSLAQAAPTAVVGCALSGLISGTFCALVPAWMQDRGIQQTTIALFMLMTVLGGFAFQVPVGGASDRFDRRVVLAALGLVFAVAAYAMVRLPRSQPVVSPAAASLFMSALYPVCVADAHDRMPSDRVVAMSGQLILVSGLGSVVGPLIGAILMARFEINGVFYFMATAVLLPALVAGLASLIPPPSRHLKPPFDILTPQAGPLAHDPLSSSGEPSKLDLGWVPTSQR